MVRPREFDRDTALERATEVFWEKGFAATATEELVEAMGIGRQSLYNTFGDKRRLYLEVLETYQRRTTAGHLKRLSDPFSPTDGLLALLTGLVGEDDRLRTLGCMGVNAVGEFGTSDPEVSAVRAKIAPALWTGLVSRVHEGQASGEFDRTMDPEEAAVFVLMTMSGIQLAARGGVGAADLQKLARFSVHRLIAK